MSKLFIIECCLGESDEFPIYHRVQAKDHCQALETEVGADSMEDFEFVGISGGLQEHKYHCKRFGWHISVFECPLDYEDFELFRDNIDWLRSIKGGE